MPHTIKISKAVEYDRLEKECDTSGIVLALFKDGEREFTWFHNR